MIAFFVHTSINNFTINHSKIKLLYIVCSACPLNIENSLNVISKYRVSNNRAKKSRFILSSVWILPRKNRVNAKNMDTVWYRSLILWLGCTYLFKWIAIYPIICFLFEIFRICLALSVSARYCCRKQFVRTIWGGGGEKILLGVN